MKGKLIVFDGLDGSGKTTVLKAAVNFLRKGKKVFDLVAWSKKHHALPETAEFSGYDVILSAEPTHAWIGAAIRNEIIRDGQGYSGRDAAAAFALDRQILYTRCIIPALKMGKLIVQDRCVSSSIAYQPIQKNPAPLTHVLSLAGNRLALKYPPHTLIIASCPAKVAFSRLHGRVSKRDNAVFEKLVFMKKLSARFHAPWYKKFWEKRGTQVIYLNTNQPLNAVTSSTTTLLRKILYS
ncbi:hypothetical protein HY477_04225 [Candidatus Uhrbacteria bacterium]|nr:hypothetical protein [Candidatus Uhrbacteria bacterium]